MTYNFRTRLFSYESLFKNNKIDLNSLQSHKIINVLRLKTGDPINMFNGNNGEWNGQIEIHKPIVKFICKNMIKKPQLEYGPFLIFSPLKQIRNDWLVEKASECGVSKLIPTLMKRTVVKKFNKERYMKRIISACEQTGRISLPEITDLKDFKEQIDMCVAENKVLLFCNELRSSPQITEFVNKIDKEKLVIIIGPEGGFEEEERTYIKNLKNIVECSLGPRVYRAETAAILALSIFQ